MMHPTFFERLKCESKSENNIKGVMVHSLACNTLGVEGHVGTPGWGLG